MAGLYENKNAGDPTKWLPDPDRSQQRRVPRRRRRACNARADLRRRRQKHKLSFYYDNQGRIWDDSRPPSRPSPPWPTASRCCSLAQVGWTSTMTNKLLVEGALRQPRRGVRQPVPGGGQHLPRAHSGHRADHAACSTAARAATAARARSSATARRRSTRLSGVGVVRHRLALVQGGCHRHVGADAQLVADQHVGAALPLHQRRADAVHAVRAGRARHGLEGRSARSASSSRTAGRSTGSR